LGQGVGLLAQPVGQQLHEQGAAGGFGLDFDVVEGVARFGS